MKTIFKLLAVLALAAATFSQHTTASAGDVFHFKGRGADAFFSSSPDGCVVTNVFLFASEEIFQNPPGPGSASSGTFLSIFKYDACLGTPPLLDAFGFASLADPDFQVSRKLTSATMNATVNVFDFVSGASFDVDVNLAWTGAGPLSREHGTFHFNTPGCKLNRHFNRTFRGAEASGSVSDGGTNFTPDPSLGASLSSDKSGDVVFGCN